MYASSSSMPGARTRTSRSPCGHASTPRSCLAHPPKSTGSKPACSSAASSPSAWSSSAGTVSVRQHQLVAEDAVEVPGDERLKPVAREERHLAECDLALDVEEVDADERKSLRELAGG